MADLKIAKGSLLVLCLGALAMGFAPRADILILCKL